MKIVFTNIVCLSIVLVLFTCVNAQLIGSTPPRTKPLYKKIMPGDKVIDTSKITPDKVDFFPAEDYLFNQYKPGTKLHLQVVNKNGKEVFRLQRYFLEVARAIPAYMLSETIYFDKKTLAFISKKTANRGHNFMTEVEFVDGKLIGDLTPKHPNYKPYKYNESYEHTFFEFSMLQYLIVALPLKDCYRLSVPVIYLNRNGSDIHWVNIVVLGSEKVEVEEKTYDAWKVLASTQKEEKEFWIDKTKQTVIKMQRK